MKAKHFILGALLVAAPALAKDPVDKSTQAVKLPRADVDMLKKIHQANREEIELGQVAQQVSMRDDVKQFGKMMVDDHKMADEKITKMADAHGVPMGDDADAMKLADKFRKKDVKDFDKDYLTKMVKDHDHVINMIGTKSNDLKGDFQAMLNDMLPTLRKHRTEAKRLLDEVKSEKNTASTGNRQGRSDRIRR